MKALFTDAEHHQASALLSEPNELGELRELIAHVRGLGEPTMLYLELDGQTMAIGLGHPRSVLSFAARDGSNYHSVGDLSRIGSIPFWNLDQLDDFFADSAIPEAEAITALLAFASTRERPPGVHWEADW